VRSIKLDRILSGETSLQPVLAKARELRALAGLLDGFLPPELSRQVRVVNYRDGEVVLGASSAAIAAKLRLLAPSLVIFFSKQRLQVSSVRPVVQPNASQPVDIAPQKSVYFSTPTLDTLRRLYQEMRDSPAREALRTILARRGVIPAGPPPQKEAGSPAGRRRRT
jgi:hypothetical protein